MTIRALLVLPTVLLLAGCAGSGRDRASLPVVEVRHQEVAVTASADGLVEPIRTVEVKSKASGEIIALAVDTGDEVEEGRVLVQLLPRDAQNLYEQAAADLEAAEARLENARLQLARAQRLHQEGLLPASDLELAELALTNARTEVIRARKNLDNAAERLAETTVRSPISGTVIGKSVEIGQVVSSAVSQVTGGTLLLTLADLNQVQVRSLVDEVDIGKLRPGMPVRIRVEAHPERQFTGEVFKIEPQAVVEQNVTMFPVLTRIDNSERLLKPGMNAEVEILIERRENALAVPNGAVKSPEEARLIAEILGLKVAASDPSGIGRSPGERGALDGEPRSGRRGESRRMTVIVAGNGGYEIRPVVSGLRNWEITEIVSGLQAGERVALLPSAAQLRQSQEFRERIQRVRGMPGVSSQRSRSNGQ